MSVTVRICDRGAWKCEFDHTQGRHQCVRFAVWKIELVLVTDTGHIVHGTVDLHLCKPCATIVRFADVIPFNEQWLELGDQLAAAGYGHPIHERCTLNLIRI